MTDVLFFSGSQVLDRKQFLIFFFVLLQSILLSLLFSFLCRLVSVTKNWMLISFSYIPAEGLGSCPCSAVKLLVQETMRWSALRPF